MQDKIFVTGGTGFIGQKLISRLINDGYIIYCLYRSEEKIKSLKEIFNEQQIKFIKGTLQDYEVLREGMQDCQKVFHIAALARAWAADPYDFYRINVEGTRNILRAAKETGGKRVVFTSTGGTLASGELNAPSSESTERETPFYNLYESTKSLAEQEVRNFAENGLDAIIVNPTRVYGPGTLSISNAATILIEKYIKGKWRLMLGNGSSVGNFTYVNDVVEGHIKAMENGKAGGQYILGGENLRLKDFFTKIAEQGGKKYKMYKLPMSLAMGFAQFEQIKASFFNKPPLITPGWVRKYSKNWAYTSEKAKDEIGYEITPADQAIRETIDWIKESE